MTYQDCRPWAGSLIKTMIVRGIGIRDTGTVLNISVTKVSKVLESSEYRIQPMKTRYDG
jgi:hypothetical protein